MVMRDDVKFPGKGGDLVLPEGGKTAQPRDEQDGEPDTLPLVIERAIADYDSRHRPANQSGRGVGITVI